MYDVIILKEYMEFQVTEQQEVGQNYIIKYILKYDIIEGNKLCEME